MICFDFFMTLRKIYIFCRLPCRRRCACVRRTRVIVTHSQDIFFCSYNSFGLVSSASTLLHHFILMQRKCTHIASRNIRDDDDIFWSGGGNATSSWINVHLVKKMKRSNEETKNIWFLDSSIHQVILYVNENTKSKLIRVEKKNLFYHIYHIWPHNENTWTSKKLF